MNPQSYTIQDSNGAHSRDCFVVNCLEETPLLTLALAARQEKWKQILHSSIDVVWSLHWSCSVQDYRWESAKQPDGMDASIETAP